jgi:hypothetical protein
MVETVIGLGFTFFMVVVVGGGTLLVTAASLAVPGYFLYTLAQANARNAQLLKTGEPAAAKVLAVQTTGTTINDAPQVKLLLEVHPTGRPAFHAEATTLVSLVEIPRVQPGHMVGVRFDPANPAQVAVERLAA